MREPPQIKSRSWNRMPTKRCSADGILNEFILVDDDEVIILDFPRKSKGKAPKKSRTRNKSVVQGVISLDVVDDTEDVHKAGSSSSRKSLATKLQTSAQVDNDDYQFIQEKRIRFGLGSESESDFSESDCSDCEILEGSGREVRGQWEKAFLEKMKKAGKAGPSNLHYDANFRPGFESRTVQDDQTSSFSTRCNPNSRKETSSAFFRTEKSGKAGLYEEAGPSNLQCDTDTFMAQRTPILYWYARKSKKAHQDGIQDDGTKAREADHEEV